MVVLAVVAALAIALLVYLCDRRSQRKDHYNPFGPSTALCHAGFIGSMILSSLFLRFFVPYHFHTDPLMLLEQLLRIALCAGIALIVHGLLLKLTTRMTRT